MLLALIEMVDYKNFEALDIRVGTILKATVFDEAKRPAYKLEIDFGTEVGLKQSSAQITDLYSIENLIGKQVLAVVNLESKRIAGFKSEVLVLGCYNSENQVVLIQPEQLVNNGSKLG